MFALTEVGWVMGEAKKGIKMVENLTAHSMNAADERKEGYDWKGEEGWWLIIQGLEFESHLE